MVFWVVSVDDLRDLFAVMLGVWFDMVFGLLRVHGFKGFGWVVDAWFDD